MKSVAIVGGGYIGAEVARALDPHCNVTLIEQREAFTHTPPMIRGVVQPGLVEQALMPYDRLLKRGQVIRSRAVSLSSEAVDLADGNAIAADAIVVATGSNYAAPFRSHGESLDPLRQAQAEAHDMIQTARRIAVVGSGPVGTELAGEIKAAMAGKDVILISATHSLFPDFPPRLGSELLRKLDLLGVEVIHGQQVTDLAQTDRPYAGALTLSSGQRIEADVVFPAIGARPQSTLLADLPGAEIGPDGRIRTDRWMRPSDLPNLFAAGDVADNGDAMTIVGATRQAPWLVRTIRHVLNNRPVSRLAPYRPWGKAPILVPLGEHMGASYLPPAGVMGNTPTRLIKGRNLFIPKHRKQFGLD